VLALVQFILFFVEKTTTDGVLAFCRKLVCSIGPFLSRICSSVQF